MGEQPTKEGVNEALFTQLILTLHAAAMQHLGKVMNPATKKVERDLEQARMTIDMLDILKEKTRGNLNPDETRLLEHLLFELHMNYLDELEAEGKRREGKEEPEAQATETSTDRA